MTSFLSITVWNTLSHVSALRWTGGRGRYRQVWFHRALHVGHANALCHTPPFHKPSDDGVCRNKVSLDVYTFFLEDVSEETFPWNPDAF